MGNGCRSMGSYLFVDLDAQGRQLLLALQDQNKDILLVLRDVQIGVQTMQANGVSSSAGNRLANTAGDSPNMVHSSQNAVMQRAMPTGKLKELQDRLQTSNANVNQAVKQLKPDDNKSSSLGFYGMIVAYIAFSYYF